MPAGQLAELAAAGHDRSDQLRQPDHGAGVRLAFGLVGVQVGVREVVGQAAGQDGGQFPGEVGRVAQSGAHALSDERRGEVRGVAEQEDPPVAPAVGDLGAEGVLGHPHDVQLVERYRLGPRGDERVQTGDVAVVVGGLGGAEAELPPVAGVADAHVGPGAAGVADLVHAFPLGQVAGGVHVDDQPALVELQVGHVRVDRGAGDAVGAVAAEHVGGQQGVRRCRAHGR